MYFVGLPPNSHSYRLTILFIFILFIISIPHGYAQNKSGSKYFNEQNQQIKEQPLPKKKLITPEKKQLQERIVVNPKLDWAVKDFLTKTLVESRTLKSLEQEGVYHDLVTTRGVRVEVGYSDEECFEKIVDHLNLEEERIEANFIKQKKCIILLSPEEILQLTDLEGIKKIRFPTLLIEQFYNTGAEAMEATYWHEHGVEGRGVKIAVIDMGFDGKENITYDRYVTFCPWYGCPTGSTHGTDVAMIIREWVASESELYLLHVGNSITYVIQALDWCLNNGIDIINYSMGSFPYNFPPWYNPSDSDSRTEADLARKIRELYNHGIIFVASSGNYGDAHYQGQFSDPDGNRFTKFGYSIDEELSFGCNFTGKIKVFLYTDRGPSDFQICVHDKNSGLFTNCGAAFGRSIDWQTNYSGLGIKYIGSDDPTGVNVNMDLYIDGYPCSNEIEYNVPEQSLIYPAGVDNAVSIGATHYQTYNEIEKYSSRGPGDGTGGYVVKPDFVGPDGFMSLWGTSFSVPHVAGGIALLYQAYGKNWDAIKNILQLNCIDYGDAGKDNTWGYGAVKLADDEYELNNSFFQAREIIEGSYVNLKAFDEDYFKVYVNGGILTCTINFEHDRGDLDLYLYDQNYNMVDSSTGTSDEETVQCMVSSSGYYYIQIHGFGGGKNIYSMNVSINSLPTISGYVRTEGGSGISGVTLSFSNGGGSTITNSNGYYSKQVPYGWSGTVTPSKSGYTFSPPSRSYSNVTSNQTNQDYTGYPRSTHKPMPWLHLLLRE